MSYKKMKTLQSLATAQGIKLVTISDFVKFSRRVEV